MTGAANCPFKLMNAERPATGSAGARTKLGPTQLDQRKKPGKSHVHPVS